MAEITAAVGWVVSPVIRLIIDKTHNYISNKFFKRAGLEDDMAKMETTLLEILATMSIVERQRIEDQNQVKLVWKIKDAVYDAEYVLDEFEYNVLEKKYEKQQNTVSQIASSPHVIYRDTIGKLMLKNMVQVVNKKLNQAKESAKELRELIHVNNSSNIQTHEYEPESWHLTSSIISEKIIGRENERNNLIDLLFEQVEGPPTIIQIIGQGGIGKTSLAQMVFNDPRVKDHFDKIMWLTVSDKFDKHKLTKEMLKYVCENFSTVDVSFDMIQRKLETEVSSKKILLMLDDVWYDKDGTGSYIHEKEWFTFLAPMNNAKTGCKIVITSREGSMRSNINIIRSIFMLEGLNDEDSWSLFQLCAFDDKNHSKRQLLEPIGKMIVSKLMGSALAIRVVGTQLRGISDEEMWKRFLNENLADMSDIMKILYRSYEHLPEHLKRCFAYCSLFPKDYRLEPNHLVYMWIAQGFIHSENRNKLEDVGKSYFHTLLDRSFFQVIKKDNKEYYVMHDLMNDLACHVSKGECYILDKNDSIKNLGFIRHLSVTREAIGSLKNMHGLDKLSTLVLLFDAHRSPEDISNLFIMLKRIRVLHIGWRVQSLYKISQCKHLRYLALPNCNKESLDAITKLHLLSTLFLIQDTLEWVKVPKFPTSMASGIYGNLTNFGDLDNRQLVHPSTFWSVGSARLCVDNKKGGRRLDQLGNVIDIKGPLKISGLENATCKKEAIKAKLSTKQNVTVLELNWGNSSLEVECRKCYEVLEALNPNPNLEVLSMNGYPGAAWPSWLESNFLSIVNSIELSQCERIKKVPALGQLPLLQYLHISHLTAVRIIGHEFYGNGRFPCLRYLEINGLLSLEEWCHPSSGSIFPELNILKINDCPKFIISEVNGFPSTPYLKISCPSHNMICKALLQGPNSLRAIIKLEITSYKGLITLESLHILVYLKRFIINDCQDLVSLPEMEYFYSLEYLAILGCSKLRSFPSKGLPVALRLLWIGGDVHHDLKEQIQNKKGHNWDKIAAISECDLYSTNIRNNYDPWSIFLYEGPVQEYAPRHAEIDKYKVNKDVQLEHSTE